MKSCRKCRPERSSCMWSSHGTSTQSAGSQPAQEHYTWTGADILVQLLSRLGEAYDCLFICMSSRFVHNEVADSLTAIRSSRCLSDLLNAEDQFVRYTATVVYIFSQLNMSFKEVEATRPPRTLRQKGVAWHFKTPFAPSLSAGYFHWIW